LLAKRVALMNDLVADCVRQRHPGNLAGVGRMFGYPSQNVLRKPWAVAATFIRRSTVVRLMSDSGPRIPSSGFRPKAG